MTGDSDDREAAPGADADLAEHLAAWTPPWARPAPSGRGGKTDGGERTDDEPGASASGPGRQADDVDADAAVVPGPVGDVAAPVPAAPGTVEAHTSGTDTPGPGTPEADAPDADVPDTGTPTGAVPEVDAEEEPSAAPADAAAESGDAADGDGAADDGEPALPELDDPERLRGAVEAILMVVDEPVPEETLAQILQRPAELVLDTLRRLAESYTAQRRGFDLRRAAGGWRIYSRDEFAGYVERFVLDGQQVRLTQAALETLAVVAYKQPVTRGRISAIRGVNCDGVVRTLLTRGLIEDCGSEPDSGAHLYRTTILFLERMGIDSPDELPDLAPLLPDDLPEEV